MPNGCRKLPYWKMFGSTRADRPKNVFPGCGGMGSYPIWNSETHNFSSIKATHTQTNIQFRFYHYLYQNFGILKRMQSSTNTQSHTKLNQTIGLSVFIMLMGWLHCFLDFRWKSSTRKNCQGINENSFQMKEKKTCSSTRRIDFFFCMEKTLLKEFRFGVWQSPLNGSVLEWERPQHRIRNRWQFVCCLNNTYAFYCHSVNCFKWLHWYLMKNPTKYSNIGTFNKRTFPATRIPFDTNWMWFCFVIVSAKKCIGQIWIDFVFVSFICISVVDRVIFCWVTVQQRISHSHCTVPSASKV